MERGYLSTSQNHALEKCQITPHHLCLVTSIFKASGHGSRNLRIYFSQSVFEQELSLGVASAIVVFVVAS